MLWQSFKYDYISFSCNFGFPSSIMWSWAASSNFRSNLPLIIFFASEVWERWCNEVFSFRSSSISVLFYSMYCASIFAFKSHGELFRIFPFLGNCKFYSGDTNLIRIIEPNAVSCCAMQTNIPNIQRGKICKNKLIIKLFRHSSASPDQIIHYNYISALLTLPINVS